jgi:ribosomal protein S18 acetylase RimI-like enzyme
VTTEVRPARLEDIGQLNSLMYELHDFHHQSLPDDIKTAEQVEKEKSIARYLEDPECLVYVSVDSVTYKINGFVTGHFCELVSVVSKPIMMGSVDELYVKPCYRNRGVANELMQRLEFTFEQYGVKKVFVEVWQFNQSALSFYQQNGFEHHIHWLSKPISTQGQ